MRIAIGLLIAAAAFGTLYHLLHGIDFDKFIAAVTAQSPMKIAIAGALVVAGYSNLVFYDRFALHTIGKRHIPFPVVAFASFTSYTIGHSLGAATLTCGLVRFRVYSAWNLTVVDIAKIAFMTGITFWLGNIFTLGLAVACVPGALGTIDHLSDGLNRLTGLAGLILIGGYLVWIAWRPRIVGRDNWRIALPNARCTLLQIGIGTIDRGLASLSLFMLLPASPAVGFPTVMVVFVIATLLGAISHTPGSLGVVEAAILVGLPQYPREELLAIVLTFRVLDFFLPLIFATVLFGTRELHLIKRNSRDRSVERLADSGPNLVRGSRAR